MRDEGTAGDEGQGTRDEGTAGDEGRGTRDKGIKRLGGVLRIKKLLWALRAA